MEWHIYFVSKTLNKTKTDQTELFQNQSVLTSSIVSHSSSANRIIAGAQLDNTTFTQLTTCNYEIHFSTMY